MSRRSRSVRPRPTPAIRVLVEAVVVGALLAVAVAAAWVILTPAVFAEVNSSGASLDAVEARRQFGIEAWFAVFCAVAGAICGVYLMWRHRIVPVVVQLVLAATGLAFAVLAWRLGNLLGPGDPGDRAEGVPAGTLVELPMDLTAYGVLLLWPLAAVIAGIATASLMGVDGDAQQRRH